MSIDVFNSAYNDLAEYIEGVRAQYDYLPLNTVRSGLTVQLLSELSSSMAIRHLNYLMESLNDSVAHTITSLGNNDTRDRFDPKDFKIIPFTVCDLLRAKCSGKFN